jgi:hypothetical protein
MTIQVMAVGAIMLRVLALIFMVAQDLAMPLLGSTAAFIPITDGDGVVTVTAGAVMAGAVMAGAVMAGAVTAGAGADIIIPITVMVMVMVMVTTANTVITEVEEGIITTIQLLVIAPHEV